MMSQSYELAEAERAEEREKYAFQTADMSKKLTFAANINTMFTELPTLEQRIEAAAKCGFKVFESTVPFSSPPAALRAAAQEHGLACALLNTWPGPGNLGIACRPDKVAEFKEKLDLTITYAEALDCHNVHVIAGCVQPGDDLASVEETYISNLKYAAQRLAERRITLLVEFVNSTLTCPGYLVDTLDKALDYIARIAEPNVRLQMDVFHLQVAHGNLTRHLTQNMAHTGYIQISQCPLRGAPSSAGEINYDYVLGVIRDAGYSGPAVGLEYVPGEGDGATQRGLAWMDKWL